MSIATRIESIEGHISDAYQGLQGLGADLTNINKNIENISMVLDDIYDSMPQVSGEGTSLTLDDTRVGKIKSTLKGNTSQTGTPTPTTPIPVNVVSGDNEINVCGKNIFIPTLKVDDTNISTTRCTVSLSGDEYTVSATGNDMYFGNIVSSGTAYQNIFGTLYDVEGITNLVFKPTNTDFDKNFVCYYDKNKVSLGYVQINNSTGLITPVVNTKYIGFRIGKGNSVSGTSYSTKFQLEKGSSASTYEPYQGNTYNIDLPVENLFDTSLLPMTKNGVTISKDDEGNVVLNGTPTITSGYIGFDFTLSSTYLKAGTYTSSIKNKIGGIGITINQTTPGGILNLTMSDTVNSKTGTLTTDLINGTIGVNVRYDVGTLTNFILNPQLEIGSKAHKYTPYGTTPIELCKIGNYQDYFYKDSGKWYLHKEIGKVVLNGSESSLSRGGTGTTGYYRWRVVLDNPLLATSTTTIVPLLCNRLANVTVANTYGGREGFAVDVAGNYAFFYIDETKTYSLDDMKVWLASNNLVVYYILATPVNTALEDM